MEKEKRSRVCRKPRSMSPNTEKARAVILPTRLQVCKANAVDVNVKANDARAITGP